MSNIRNKVLGYVNRLKAKSVFPCNLTIRNGRQQNVNPGQQTEWLGDFAGKRPGEPVVATGGPGGRRFAMTKYGFLYYLDSFEYAFRSDHREVKRDPEWLRFYMARADDVFRTVDHEGREGVVRAAGIPCWKCHILVPMRLIEVDHSRPNAAPDDEAIAKHFRHNNLTAGGPKGMKGQVTMMNMYGGPTPIGSRADRYTLNTAGRMIFQIIISAGQYGELVRVCRNSFANLRPVCSACNKARNREGYSKFPPRHGTVRRAAPGLTRLPNDKKAKK